MSDMGKYISNFSKSGALQALAEQYGVQAALIEQKEF